MENWISRDQRKKRSPLWMKILLIFLIFIAGGLLLIRFYPQILRDKKIAGTSLQKILEIKNKQIKTPAQAESIFVNIMENLGLGHVEIEKQPLNFNGVKKPYPCYKTSWPQSFPFVWFTLRLQDNCRRSENLIYDALEIKGGKSMLALLVEPGYGDTIVEMVLVTDKNTSPRATSISFIFDDFANFKSKEALNLIWLDFPFGFVLWPDEIPDTKLAKALRSGKGQCILELPTDIESWEIIFKSHQLSGIIENSQLNDENFGKVLEMFPGLEAFYFNEDNGIDRNLVEMLINEVEKLKLVYIYRKKVPGLVDSLVYSSGLKIKKLTGVINCNGLTDKKLKSSILKQTGFLNKYNKGLYFINSYLENVELIASLLPFFAKLNIIVVPPLRNAQLVERL